MFHKIVAAIDGSHGARKALQVACELAKQYEAELHVIAIAEDLPPSTTMAGSLLEAKQEAAEYFNRLIISAGLIATASGVRLIAHTLVGHEVETLITFVEASRYDLLVIGFQGHSKIFRQDWGSTSQKLTELAPCSVLVVK